jgi:trans-aconitate 2-methyltransferase
MADTWDPERYLTYADERGRLPGGRRPAASTALPDDLRPEFEREFKRRLREAYPARDGRVVLPFRRIFAVGRRAA